MISASPSSLSYKNEDDRLPIQLAMFFVDSVCYAPLLAKEGVKHKVGGDGKRGGFLVVDPINKEGCTLQLVVLVKGLNDNPCRNLYDKAYLDVMKELKDANLRLIKDDIKNLGFFFYTYRFQGCRQRFEFLSNWCPEGLKDY